MVNFALFWISFFAIIFFILSLACKIIAAALFALSTSIEQIIPLCVIPFIIVAGIFFSCVVFGDGFKLNGEIVILAILFTMVLAVMNYLSFGILEFVIERISLIIFYFGMIFEFFSDAFQNKYKNNLMKIVKKVDKC